MSQPARPLVRGRIPWAWGVLALTLLTLRFFLAVRAPRSYDMGSWQMIAENTLAGGRIYEATHRYNFPPPWSWWLVLFDWIARHGLPFPAVVRCFLTLIDAGSACLLFRLVQRYGLARSPWMTAILFLANPVGIWVSAVQGQFDNLSIFFLLAAVCVSAPGCDQGRGPRLAGLYLFLSIASKQVTALHPLLWLRRRRDPKEFLMPYILMVLFLLPYIGQWRAIRDAVLLYPSVPRSYGFSEWVLFDSRMARPVALMAFLAGVLAVWLVGRKELPRACLFLFLVLLFFAPGLGSQYFVWPLTFGVLYGGIGYWLCTACAVLWIVGSHFGLPGSGQWVGHLVWLSVAFWAIREARALGLLPRRCASFSKVGQRSLAVKALPRASRP